MSDALSLGVRRWVLSDPHFPAKFYPIVPDERSYIIGPQPPARAGGDLPVPPEDLWLGYAKSREDYLSNGRARVERLKQHVVDGGFPLAPTARVLDLGCASGIMLRWFRENAEQGEAWGVDIAAKPILWCQQHLSPPFKFVTSTSYPHLPFEDGYFDLIYAGSVFTHIADLADTWVMELRRICGKGGALFLTVHDSHYIDLMMQTSAVDNPRMKDRLAQFDGETHFTTDGFAMFAINRAPGHGGKEHAQVFYDTEFLTQQWGNYLQIVKVIPRALGGPQTGFLMRKP